MSKKQFTKIYLHVGGDNPITYYNGDVLQYDRTADMSMVAYNQREEKPMYEVKSEHGVMLDLVPTIQHARKVRDRGGAPDGRYINEIQPGTGLKRRVT